MKRFLCALLAVLMLCTMAVGMVSCGVSMESIKEKCEELKKDGEIAGFVEGEKTIRAWTADYKETFVAQEFDEKDDAKKAYDEAKKAMDEMEAAGEDVSNYKLVRKGNIVISATKDLYKKII